MRRSAALALVASWGVYAPVSSMVPHQKAFRSKHVTIGTPSTCRFLHHEDLDQEMMGTPSRSNHTNANIPGLTRREMVSFGPLLAAVLSTSGVTLPPPASANTNTNPAQEYSVLSLKQPQIPFSTQRQYKSVTLPNGLHVLLVSDKQSIRSSAAFSIAGGGQFSDPTDLPGCAHLMEHMVLSSSNGFSALRKSQVDFEVWLEDVEGASNAFTGYEKVCFHFTSPPEAFQEALARFARLFNEPDVFRICQNEEVLKREIRRVSAELDIENESTQLFFLVKEMMNREHPYSRFGRGNIFTLEQQAKEAGINVGSRLFQFFREFYQPSQGLLVVIGPNDISTLERWVVPFSFTLSRERMSSPLPRSFPEPLKTSNKVRHFLLHRKKSEFPLKEALETMSMQWVLGLDYEAGSKGKPIVTATQIGFVLSQILGRRGPGSLYYSLYKRKWVPTGNQGLPRITFPVDVSGFQLLKLDITLTLEGFTNRAAVASDVFKAMNAVPRFQISRQILSQYAVVAQLHGYILASRPPDAIELASDSQVDPEALSVFNPEKWTRFPLPSDQRSIFALQRAMKDILVNMCDASNAIIITTCSDEAIRRAKEKITIGESVPFVSPHNWPSASITGAKFIRDDLLIFPGLIGDILLYSREDDELLPPLTNNLIPPLLRPPRLSQQVLDVNAGRNANWRILQPGINTVRLRIPRMPPEASCRSCFVFQLLSPRPARANTRKAAYAELWKVSFEKAVVDLVSLLRISTGIAARLILFPINHNIFLFLFSG